MSEIVAAPGGRGEAQALVRRDDAGFWRSLRRFVRSSPTGTVAACFLILVALVAIFAGQLVPFDPIEANYGAARLAPNAEHLFGTDHMGRDTLARVFFGARISLVVALTSVFVGDSIGLCWGVVSGYLGGRFDLISQRILDVMMAFPGLILAMLLLSGVGAGLSTVILAIAVTRIPLSTRVIRSVALSVKEYAYVEAAKTVGATTPRIMLRHIAPQCIAPFLVVATANIGVAMVTEAALSFLGVGVPPPAPSWGNMLGGILAETFRPPWWLVVFPGLALTMTVLCANLFGDAIRDYLDPKMKGRVIE
ncbi:MAG: ABC transporter permease [Chloroflexi bacterium]|nr:ABC transporter permease [Chloroflexota bacterium]MCL5108328.1 ABC transporter permease [Chloroflexota bacterium]MDA8218254.1 ABC transporter permease [Dehalococcoidales bacterium]